MSVPRFEITELKENNMHGIMYRRISIDKPANIQMKQA